MSSRHHAAIPFGAVGLLIVGGLHALAQPPGQTPPAPITDATPLAAFSGAPSVSITNGQIKAKIYLPLADKGFYQGVRFDRAGMIGSLTYRGHDYYRPWFTARSPMVRDYVFQGADVIAGPNTAAMGPVEEFNGAGGALGYAEAKPGGLFVKIGVGVLRRLDDSPYSFALQLPLVDPGKRSQKITRSSAAFTQVLADPGTGYAYVYTKTVALTPGRPEMVIAHVLKNTGPKTIETTVYDHNFLDIDGAGPAEGLEVSAPYPLSLDRAPAPELAKVADGKVTYLSSLNTTQHVQGGLTGFGPTPAAYDFHVADPKTGAGVRIRGDRPLDHVALWSAQPVMAVEPFVKMSIAPGETFRWSYRYTYDVKPRPKVG